MLNTMLRLDNLSSFILLSIGLFAGLILIYSVKFIPHLLQNSTGLRREGAGFMRGRSHLGQYYLWTILTAIASAGVILANNLILLLILWGFLGLTLYLLINIAGDSKASEAAKKTFIIVGGSDCLMLLSVGIIYYLTGTFQMDKIRLPILGSELSTIAYLLLAIACFAKAGAMPFHSWIPDCAESAPIPVTAFLPASLDKLLGIYLLARISLDLFIMSEPVHLFLMIIGAITILAAVMMALIQHNLKRLLGYHAVSQVGYMVLGIGTGNPIGIAGGLFHMLNNAMYKSCLFLTGGAVEYKTGTAELDKLGGLSKVMPITFFSCLIASLSISGVPPFNGFVSKWMVYQGLIIKSQIPNPKSQIIGILCLVAAMFGSGLTLASFVKLLHTTFLGQSTHQLTHTKHEVPWTMWLPMVILAGLCIIFGVFAFQIPLKYFIFPSLTVITQHPTPILIGFWSPSWATLLILVGLLLGIIIYSLGKVYPIRNFIFPVKIGISNGVKVREDKSYVGGESLAKEVRPSGVDFYQTIRELPFLKTIYKKAEEKFFDIYDQGKRIISPFTRVLQYLHNGILPTYLAWCLLGMMVMFLVLR